jgi:hypothetical protein
LLSTNSTKPYAAGHNYPVLVGDLEAIDLAQAGNWPVIAYDHPDRNEHRQTEFMASIRKAGMNHPSAALAASRSSGFCSQLAVIREVGLRASGTTGYPRHDPGASSDDAAYFAKFLKF